MDTSPAVTACLALLEGPDPARAVELFAPGATVVDDGATHRGRDAVLAWLTGPASAFTTTSTRLSSERSGLTSVLRILLEGDFPGGRVELRYAFVEDPDGLITALTISA